MSFSGGRTIRLVYKHEKGTTKLIKTSNDYQVPNNIRQHRILTAIQSSNGLPNFSRNACLMSPRSISERLTMILIRVLSFVPSPFMEQQRRSAKKPTLLLTHLTMKEICFSYLTVLINPRTMPEEGWLSLTLEH